MSSVLGVTISTIAREGALEKVSHFLLSNQQHLIFTPNPEMIVKAHSDNYFKEVLNQGALNLCDGKGLQFALWWQGLRTERITGVDFMLEICSLAEKNNKKVFLLGSGKDEVVQKTAQEIKNKFPTLEIVGTHRGWGMMEELSGKLTYNTDGNQLILDMINHTKPDILFVAFGMGKQEKWLVENLPKLPTVTIGMGVGGAFDYISGTVPRAPLLMRNLGLEWAYRLIKEPKRFKRICNATVGFIILYFSYGRKLK
jgi:N-acetylglucosaminyldiphosphoundecaprenol N-acetyl-beta-D-mannosaminyltransferase